MTRLVIYDIEHVPAGRSASPCRFVRDAVVLCNVTNNMSHIYLNNKKELYICYRQIVISNKNSVGVSVVFFMEIFCFTLYGYGFIVHTHPTTTYHLLGIPTENTQNGRIPLSIYLLIILKKRSFLPEKNSGI